MYNEKKYVEVSVLDYHPYLVSLPLAILLSLHLVTLLMFFSYFVES